MSREKTGLGKGLGALIPSTSTPKSTEGSYYAETTGYQEVPIGSISVNPYQPRDVFNEDALNSLSLSIREVGVLQPVLIRRKTSDTFELIAGERRWRAAKRAGMETIPAIVRDVEDLTSLEHALVENLHRQDLGPLEEAAAYQQLIDDFQLSQESVAKRVGKSRPTIANALRLLQLPSSAKGFASPGGTHFTELFSKYFLRHSGNTIEAIGNSEKILRETRMPAVAIRYGSTEDLITDSQMLLKVLTEAISSWFSEPFEENYL